MAQVDLRLDLESRWPESQIAPSLARIASLVTLLGDPQLACPVIHVAGTNGKTSTARMIESLLRSAGLRTGLFTSPHLERVNERIRLDGEPVDDEYLERAWAEIEPYVHVVDGQSMADGGIRMTAFEVLAGLGFAIFADAPVDVAVVEVGMGGSWDATNVVQPAVAVVTPIGMDHMEYLGDTIALIAAEKAGIIKAQVPTVLAEQAPEADAALQDRADEAGAPLYREGVEFALAEREVAVGGQQLAIRGLHAEYRDIFLPLFGEHQAHNAAVALAGVEAFFGTALDETVVQSGFAEATSPGRLEVLRRNPTVLVDAAHNPHGAEALAGALADSFDFGSLVAVVGVLGDKDAHGLLAALEPVLDTVIVTEPASPRAMSAEALAQIAVEVLDDDRVDVAADLPDAIDRALALAEERAPVGGAGILITGSVVLVGQARALLASGSGE